MTKYLVATLSDEQASLLQDLGWQERAMDEEMQNLLALLTGGMMDISPTPCYACAITRPNDPLDEPITKCYLCGVIVHEGCAQAKTSKGWLCGGCA